MTAATTIAAQIANRLQKDRLSTITQSIRAEIVLFPRSNLYPFKISSPLIGSYAPSFTSSSTVPGSIALSIRGKPSAGEFCRSKFIRRRGDDLAWAVKASRVFWPMIKAYFTIFGIPFSSFWMYSSEAIFAFVSSRFSRFVLSELNSSIVARFTSPSLKYLS